MQLTFFVDDNFITRLGICLVAQIILLVLIYGKRNAKQEHINAFLLFGMGVFLVTRLLHSVEMTMGFAFGLFAVFSMLRYRTESLSVRDMTYLFVSIAMALISAVSPINEFPLVIIMAALCAVALILELRVKTQCSSEKLIVYELIENIKPENHGALLDDLRIRTGLDVIDAQVLDIDFLKDTATVKVIYNEPRHEA